MNDEQMVDEYVDIFAGEMTDPEQERIEGAKLLIPAGWYNTDGTLSQTPKTADDGRKSVRFFGPILSGDRAFKIGFGFSPQLRHKPDTETPDFSYGLFLQASKAYKKANGMEPSQAAKISDIINYVATGGPQVRVVQTKDGENMVVAIRAAIEG